MVRESLETKVKMVLNIVEKMNRSKDEHLKADLYKLTNLSLQKLFATLQAKENRKLTELGEKSD